MDVFKKIDKALEGEDMDSAIPALTSYLAAAGSFSGVSKRVFAAYVLDAIDKAFRELEERRSEKLSEIKD